jgi:hypothetical protein
MENPPRREDRRRLEVARPHAGMLAALSALHVAHCSLHVRAQRRPFFGPAGGPRIGPTSVPRLGGSWCPLSARRLATLVARLMARVVARRRCPPCVGCRASNGL